jgi:prepilin-type N-terminal cleavage/methylation domain-containing protein/prepilin-type processing-associated H-X9-DG protein
MRPLPWERAFTLIELLMVIVIVAILATLSVAAASKVSDYSKRSACLSNLRQWGAALLLYTGDNNGQLPRRGQGVRMVGQFNRPEDWFNALPPFMGLATLQEMRAEGRTLKPGERSIFVCPAAQKEQSGAQTFLSYGMNMYLSQWNQPVPDNLNQISEPMKLAFMADSPGGYASTIPSAAPYSVPARHSGHACVVFCDGHAQSFNGDYLGCGKGPNMQTDIRWEVIPGSNSGTPVK